MDPVKVNVTVPFMLVELITVSVSKAFLVAPIVEASPANWVHVAAGLASLLKLT
jgi:hypothetical protein